MSDEKHGSRRRERQERAARKTQEMANQIWAHIKTQIPACSKDGVVSVDCLATAGDAYISELARKRPQEKSIILAAAIMVRSELRERFAQWAARLATADA